MCEATGGPIDTKNPRFFQAIFGKSHFALTNVTKVKIDERF
ncbi:hypothetical protein HMPREF0388_1712 [Mobiluncus curtisii ATCC 51333]|jgi:hypothetical protein|uniref:Uncharacterized protein n=1 Tax=Mobiluncus curtisii ATCC 51333 TaxID=887326 RepID=E6M0X9_9ACTO|nr:hypothetical protein HMPREF0388_1712 [Mobiluncus curtisii ATCC 51333]